LIPFFRLVCVIGGSIHHIRRKHMGFQSIYLLGKPFVILRSRVEHVLIMSWHAVPMLVRPSGTQVEISNDADKTQEHISAYITAHCTQTMRGDNKFHNDQSSSGMSCCCSGRIMEAVTFSFRS
jgi:hypothetical protein